MSEVKRYDVLQDPEDYCDCGNSAGSIEVESADGEYVRASAYDAAQSELAALREELTSRNEVIAMKAREVVEAQTAVTGWATKCKAADQRNSELTQALERGKLWMGQFRAWIGDYGVIAEDHLMVIRTLKGLPHPPSEFDKPTESGASECEPNK